MLRSEYPSELRFPDGSTLTFGRIGRSLLGWFQVRELAWMARDPMSPLLREAWGKAMKRDQNRAIADWAELNGSEVDASGVMRMLKGAQEANQGVTT